MISCDWHFVIILISFLRFLFRSVRFIYLDTFLSLLNLLILWSKKGNKKKEETKNNRKRGKIEKQKQKSPINTSYIWILRVFFFYHDLVLFWTYYSTFHVSSTLLKYSKSWSESSPFFQGKCPVWMGLTVLRHNACDFHMTRCFKRALICKQRYKILQLTIAIPLNTIIVKGYFIPMPMKKYLYLPTVIISVTACSLCLQWFT